MSVQLEHGLKLVEQELPNLKEWLDIADWHIGGSVGINGTGNDVDMIVWINNELKFGMLHAPGWEHCGAESYESCGLFDAYRKGDLNIIITDDAEYYHSWETAKQVCIYLGHFGMDDRRTRVAMHSIICDKELVNA